MIPAEHQKFEDVWEIITIQQRIFFRSSDKIFRLTNDKISVFELEEQAEFLAYANNKLLVADKKGGLYQFVNEGFKRISVAESLIRSTITAILPFSEDTLLVTSLKNGIFSLVDNELAPWPTFADDFLKKNRIYTATILPNQNIVLGTSLNGVLILNEKGRAIHHFSKNNGLQNNNILSVQSDALGNLWLGLDNGIDYIQTSSPFSLFYPDGNLEGTAYVTRIFNNKLYCGTSNGLYVTDWTSYYDPFSKQNFQLVQGTQGQVWGLEIINNQLILGHHEGTFLVKGNTAEQISTVQGAWTFLPLLQNSNLVLGGTYSGLILFEQTSNGLRFKHKLNDFNESSRIFAQDTSGEIWVTHPYRGAYRIQLSASLDSIQQVEFYNSEQGFPTDLFIHVFNVGGELVFTAERNIYKFDSQANRFVRFEDYCAIFGGNVLVKRLVTDEEKNIWYSANEKVGLLNINDVGLQKSITKQEFPPLFGQLVGGFEHIYPYGNQDVFLGTEKGFIHYQRQKTSRQTPPQALLRRVSTLIPSDSLLFGGAEQAKDSLQSSLSLPFTLNALRFDFSAQEYGKEVTYSYKLEGLDPQWSAWSSKTAKEYTNLGPGKYAFKVKARFPSQEEGIEARYHFEIQPPWYRSKVAYILYTLLASLLLLGWFLRLKARFEEEKETLRQEQEKALIIKEEEHRQAVAQSEKEIIQLQNEKLEAAVDHQNQELASLTMHFVQKNEILNKMKEELKNVGKETKEATTKKNIKRLIRLLDSDNQMDEDWERFAHYFDRVHSDFLKRLRVQYPQLTPKDHKICAYLRMNLTTKEIAPLMNISVRGVEISRYRLRKKLDLAKEDNLVEFMLRV